MRKRLFVAIGWLVCAAAAFLCAGAASVSRSRLRRLFAKSGFVLFVWVAEHLRQELTASAEPGGIAGSL